MPSHRGVSDRGRWERDSALRDMGSLITILSNGEVKVQNYMYTGERDLSLERFPNLLVRLALLDHEKRW
jgi:hypothetical protein